MFPSAAAPKGDTVEGPKLFENKPNELLSDIGPFSKIEIKAFQKMLADNREMEAYNAILATIGPDLTQEET